eukprot:8292555-Alexandrium_andersonii.AAC.1
MEGRGIYVPPPVRPKSMAPTGPPPLGATVLPPRPPASPPPPTVLLQHPRVQEVIAALLHGVVQLPAAQEGSG